MTKLTEEEARRAALVARDYEGIYPPYQAFYIHSIQYAAERAGAGFAAFWGGLSRREPAESVFGSIQEALTHAGGLSRFFWPAQQAGALGHARGKRLRSAFGLADDSPLCSRAIRNAIEHLDERLDRFLLIDPVGYFFPAPMVADHTTADEPIGHVFKLVDPDCTICVILGEKFDFKPIEYEVRRVRSLADQFMNNGSVLPK